LAWLAISLKPLFQAFKAQVSSLHLFEVQIMTIYKNFASSHHPSH
jgi:hypothetical protein